MKLNKNHTVEIRDDRESDCRDVPGIVIADGGLACRLSGKSPRVEAFVYGERIPVVPTLPFGRWKIVS
jgi:hypothetical protein